MFLVLISGLGLIMSQASLARLAYPTMSSGVTSDMPNTIPQGSTYENSNQENGETKYEAELLNIYKTPPTQDALDKRTQTLHQLEVLSKKIQTLFK